MLSYSPFLRQGIVAKSGKVSKEREGGLPQRHREHGGGAGAAAKCRLKEKLALAVQCKKLRYNRGLVTMSDWGKVVSGK